MAAPLIFRRSWSRFYRNTAMRIHAQKEAYLRSARLTDYYIVDSTRRYVFRYSGPEKTEDHGRIFTAEYHLGPVPVPALGITLAFERINAGTSVPAIYPIHFEHEKEAELTLD